jgi:hypothetical protein
MNGVKSLAPLLSALLLWAPAARAEASAEGALHGAVAQTLARVAHELKVRSPQIDPRLEAAALLLARRGGCDVPPHATIQAALWQVGVSEPVHRLLLTRFATAAPADLVSGLPTQLRTALTSRGGSSGAGRWSRYGFAAAPFDDEMSCGVLIILETFVQLSPTPRSQPLGAAPIVLQGAVLPPYHRPRLVQTTPAGETLPIPVLPPNRPAPSSDAAASFQAQLTCSTLGRYQIELLAEDKAGPTVLANFPLYCGQPAPDFASTSDRRSATASNEPDAPWQTAAEAEARLLSLLNSERQQAGRPALLPDARLTAVARAQR